MAFAALDEASLRIQHLPEHLAKIYADLPAWLAGRHVFLAVDFEATGQFYMAGKDLVFAFGLAAATWDEASQTAIVLHKSEAVIPLGKPEGANWEDYWHKMGFEMRTWHHFWKDHCETLDLLMLRTDPPTVTMKQLAERFVQEKAAAEAKLAGSKMHWLTDAMLYDATIANFFVLTRGSPSMMFFGQPGAPDAHGCVDRFNGADPFDLDSFIHGRCPSGAAADWATEIQPVKDLLKQLANTYAPHDHNPANDATNIAVQMVYANLPDGCNVEVLKTRLDKRLSQITTERQKFSVVPPARCFVWSERVN